MKIPSKIIAIALSLFIAGIAFIPRNVRSQQAQPVQIVQSVEQYKVLDLTKYNNLNQLEIDLNKLGADGWKVRTSTQALLILSRPG